MTFSVAQKTLERLDWTQILDALGSHARTPRGRARISPDESGAMPEGLFADTLDEIHARLAETAEARSLREQSLLPPLGGVSELGTALGRASRGGGLSIEELLALAETLAALRETRRFAREHEVQTPRLARIAEALPERPDLESEIERCLDPAGEVRDRASHALAAARRDARELAAQLQSRLAKTLRDPDIRAALSDDFFTVRNDRYVLPVRADTRSKVPGIVHDASGSGTTLYVEPQALVELNNRHKRAELEIEREVARVLRALSERAAGAAPDVETGLDALAHLDVAFARAGFAIALDATAPEVGDEGILRLPQLRHPALPMERSVPNDLHLGESFQILVISGPNAGGKTVAMKAAALSALFVRAGLQVPAGAGARVDLFDAILADIGDEQSIGENLSTFSAHMANLAGIVDGASRRSFVVLDEVGVGTDPSEGAALAQAILETLADAGARVIATTHYGLLKEMADVDSRFANASVEFDPETLAPTYHLRMGLPGTSSATAVAARMGLRSDVLDRAHSFLDREDRQLDRMLSELATHRAALESEQREASRLREETEAARAEYGRKLEKLQRRRDDLYRSMRDDLDQSFRNAHAQIAAVIRDLQRGGSARDAAHARERLIALAEKQREAEPEDVSPPVEALDPVDWRTARPGDPVRVVGGGVGVLQTLPDRRGRVAVSLGSARVVVPKEKVGRGDAKPKPRQPHSPLVEPPTEASAEAGRCDLRGLRVDEALDRLVESLDLASSTGTGRLLVVHGIGTGALRKAVREHLSASAYVTRVEAAGSDEGGDGATLAILD